MTDNFWIAGGLLTIIISCYFLGYLHGYHNGIKWRILESIRLDYLIDYVNENFQTKMYRKLIDQYIKMKKDKPQ